MFVFLEENEECNLGDILIFITGIDSMPQLGFRIKVDVKFCVQDDLQYPTSNTCGLKLYLPICHNNYEEF